MDLNHFASSLDIRHVIDMKIPRSEYCVLDLSHDNPALEGVTVTDPDDCQKYIDLVLARNNASVAYGGYLEQRSLYDQSDRFVDSGQRNIHLGIDFWCEAGTKVIVPVSGEVHSFKNNSDLGNYGPTIILKHQIERIVFHTLYGHLSLGSLDGLHKGKHFLAGETLATLGTPDINVNYAPHLHFQIINDMEDLEGDYPGVCAKKDLDFYTKNCPNPNLLLKFDF